MSEEDILTGENANYLEQLIAQGEATVASPWRGYFGGEAQGMVQQQMAVETAVKNSERQGGGASLNKSGQSAGQLVEYAKKQSGVSALITKYRMLGVRESKINPLQYEMVGESRLGLAAHGLSEADLTTSFSTDIVGMPVAPLKDIIACMQRVYCGTFVPEFMHISDDAQRKWLLERFEQPCPALSAADRVHLLERLNAAESLEKYLHTRYIGQKRFSLEGGDSLIPLIDTIITSAGELGVKETVIGMAHRGRLNVLVNVLGKRPADLFDEFEGKHQQVRGSGDVKYHMGFSASLKTDTYAMHLALAFNPSHLEIVGPVVEGSVRARQDRRQDAARGAALAVHVHGDAAFAGQGVVMETLNFSQASGYKTGGSIHIIVNNQIGFTTSTPDDARSTFFCTDIGKMVEMPIIHVNCDDVDSIAQAAKIAVDFRHQFKTGMIIDLVCFRRLGHNEQDEPLMTQPLMYQKIAQHPGSLAVYAKRLREEGVVSEQQFTEMRQQYRACLDKGDSAVHNVAPDDTNLFTDWKKYKSDTDYQQWRPDKPLSLSALKSLGKKITTIPDSFAAHPNLRRLVNMRREMSEGKRPIDWGMAENLSYASLLAAGYPVRLSGQDCGRGTFSHRHAVWHDQERAKRDGGRFVPLRNLAKEQGDFLVIDSILSEEGVMAFEYGYATTNPEGLVIWEGQFGDFANGAQVVIDQFIASGETKWGRYCGLTLLLPHGYEGQGPEHSSARLERYLQLCAEYNIQVCVPSTPAQIYHLLRRQVLCPTRRPLIVISPKSLLRNPEAVSTLDELSGGHFATVIGETDKPIKPNAVKRLVFCAGKIYYELRAQRRDKAQTDVAICRLEQIYPFPHDVVQAQLAKYPNAKSVVWCQEEPGNQGAWHRIYHYFRRHLQDGQRLTYALRRSSASPASGFADVHKKEQQEVIAAALDVNSVV